MTVSHPDTPSKTIPANLRLLVSEQDAATLCSTSLPTFRSWVAAGYISPVKLPFNIRRNLYRRDDLERFISSLGAAS